MASRKTDFNTEDIMGSLLGMPGQDKKEEEKPAPETVTAEPEREDVRGKDTSSDHHTGSEEAGPEGSIDKGSAPSPLFAEEEDTREYIPIDPVRLRRRDEREMKVPVSFSLSRSMAEQLKQIAYIDRVSSSEIVASLIQGFINAHQAELMEYRAIMQRRKQ